MKKKRIHGDLVIAKNRIRFVLFVFAVIALALIWRVADLKISRQDFLQDQSDARIVRNLQTAALRGMITDRNGEPLAVSAPVVTIWANPREVDLSQQRQLYKLADLLKVNREALLRKLKRKKNKAFVYLRRRINPDLWPNIDALKIKGIYQQREYRRYYPSAQATAHVIGFTNTDELGIEGLELLYDEWLSGTPGKKRVYRNRMGEIIAIDDDWVVAKPGKNLVLSIDRRIQYLAYAELKRVVLKHRAKSGSAVVLDVETGEILAMVNQPGYNPNRLSDRKPDRYKNRAVTDVFEPGSTVKPLTIMAALQSRRYAPSTLVDTGDGWFMVGRKTIKDTHAHGKIDLHTIIQKSSNVGTSKIALNLPKEMLWDTFYSFGFAQDTGSNFPGEVFGQLVKPRRIQKIEQATLSFGYGMTTTALQLAQVYSTIARGGKIIPVSFLKQSEPAVVTGQANIDEKYIRIVGKMMEKVLMPGGTAANVAIAGYRVAGKTGTVRKVSRSGAYAKEYDAVFAGFAPLSHPRLAMAVVVSEPREKGYYGGVVAGPVFKRVMAGALRILDISPDKIKKRLSPRVVDEQIKQMIKIHVGASDAENNS